MEQYEPFITARRGPGHCRAAHFMELAVVQLMPLFIPGRQARFNPSLQPRLRPSRLSLEPRAASQSKHPLRSADWPLQRAKLMVDLELRRGMEEKRNGR